MYIIVAYDADSEQRKDIRRTVNPLLHWIQGSVYAGEVKKTEVEDIKRELRECVNSARVTIWVFSNEPEICRFGAQKDLESIFI